MGKKQKPKSRGQRNREKSQHQVRELTIDKDERLPADVVYEILNLERRSGWSGSLIARSWVEKKLCEVFSADTNEWRQARHPPPQDLQFSPRTYFLDGAIHLKPLGNCPIYAFDIESEEYRVIQLPKIYDSPGMKYQPYFNEFSGFLCLTVFLDRRYEVWLLKDYNNGKWMKEYIIDHFYIGRPLAILGDGSLLLDIDVGEHGDGELYCYNLRDGTYKEKLDCYLRAKATSYVGTLFALGR